MNGESFKNIIEGLALRAEELGGVSLRLELDHKRNLRLLKDGRINDELNWIRLWANVEIRSRGECWVWSGCRNSSGYGVFKPLKLKSTSAHRVAYELWFGGLEHGQHVLHRCDNPPCCNPRHLFVGSNLDNIQDKVHKGRQTRGEDVNTARLTRSVVSSILGEFCSKYDEDWTQVTKRSWKEVALNNPPATRHMVRNIILRNVWSCVPRPDRLLGALPYLRGKFIRAGRPVSGLSGKRQGMKPIED